LSVIVSRPVHTVERDCRVWNRVVVPVSDLNENLLAEHGTFGVNRNNVCRFGRSGGVERYLRKP